MPRKLSPEEKAAERKKGGTQSRQGAGGTGSAEDKPLSRHDRAFADLYRGGPDEVRGNAKACYQLLHPRAKDRSAEVEASKLLRKPEIQAYLDACLEEVSREADVTQGRVLEELYLIATADIAGAFNADGTLKAVRDMPEAIRRAVSGVDVVEEFEGRGEGRRFVGYTKKLRFWDKPKTLELLGRHLKLFNPTLGETEPGTSAQFIVHLHREGEK